MVVWVAVDVGEEGTRWKSFRVPMVLEVLPPGPFVFGNTIGQWVCGLD
jgi:hypothetical protein